MLGRVGKIEGHFRGFGIDRHRHAHLERNPDIDPIVVGIVDATPCAGRHLANGITRHAFGVVVNVLDRLVDRIEPIFIEQADDALFTGAEAGNLRVDIPPNDLWGTRVRLDHRCQRLVELAGSVELDRRNAQSLLEGVGRVGWVGIFGSHVDEMRLAGRETEEPVSVKMGIQSIMSAGCDPVNAGIEVA